MAKNIADFFGEKKQNKAKCKNILDYDFVNEKASNISPEKLTKQDEIENGESCIFPTLNDFLNESHSKINETDFKKDI